MKTTVDKSPTTFANIATRPALNVGTATALATNLDVQTKPCVATVMAKALTNFNSEDYQWQKLKSKLSREKTNG